MSTIPEILMSLNINPNDVFAGSEKTASVAPRTSSEASDIFAVALTKLAEAGVPMGDDDEALEKLMEVYQELKARKMRGEMLDPEAEKFVEEFESAGLDKMSALKMAGGVEDVNKNTSNQEGMLASQVHATDNKQNPTAQNVKGDDGTGEQNPMAIGKKIEGETGKAQESSISANGSNAKTAMAIAANRLRYAAEVEKTAAYVYERMVTELAAAEEQAYTEKVAQAEDIMKVADLQGRVMARSFYDELAALNSGR